MTLSLTHAAIKIADVLGCDPVSHTHTHAAIKITDVLGCDPVSLALSLFSLSNDVFKKNIFFFVISDLKKSLSHTSHHILSKSELAPLLGSRNGCP